MSKISKKSRIAVARKEGIVWRDGDDFLSEYLRVGFDRQNHQKNQKFCKSSPNAFRRKKNSTKGKERIVSVQRKDILEEREFSLLVLNTEICSFDFDFDPRGLKVYYLSERLMRQMGARFDAVVAVIPVKQLRVGMTVLVSEEQEIATGKVQFENFTRLFFILDGGKSRLFSMKKKSSASRSDIA